MPSSSGPLWPVSVKAIVRTADRVLLARNNRDEWELLGGRLEPDEDPRQTATRFTLDALQTLVLDRLSPSHRGCRRPRSQ